MPDPSPAPREAPGSRVERLGEREAARQAALLRPPSETASSLVLEAPPRAGRPAEDRRPA